MYDLTADQQLRLRAAELATKVVATEISNPKTPSDLTAKMREIYDFLSEGSTTQSTPNAPKPDDVFEGIADGILRASRLAEEWVDRWVNGGGFANRSSSRY